MKNRRRAIVTGGGPETGHNESRSRKHETLVSSAGNPGSTLVVGGRPSDRARSVGGGRRGNSLRGAGGECGGATPCFAVIQDAVDAAQAGDEIRVAAGVYTDVLARPRRDILVTGVVSQIVYLTKTLAVRGRLHGDRLAPLRSGGEPDDPGCPGAGARHLWCRPGLLLCEPDQPYNTGLSSCGRQCGGSRWLLRRR